VMFAGVPANVEWDGGDAPEEINELCKRPAKDKRVGPDTASLSAFSLMLGMLVVAPRE